MDPDRLPESHDCDFVPLLLDAPVRRRELPSRAVAVPGPFSTRSGARVQVRAPSAKGPGPGSRAAGSLVCSGLCG